MGNDSQTEENFKNNTLIHFILSHSYMLFFVAIILGIITDQFVHISIIPQSYGDFGFLLMLLGSIVIYWAQKTSGKTKKQLEDTGERKFDCGPYKYSRNPTHIGLGIMTFGFSLVMQSTFILLYLVIVYTVSKLIFLPAEEKILCSKYGAAYCEYQKKVNTWL